MQVHSLGRVHTPGCDQYDVINSKDYDIYLERERDWRCWFIHVDIRKWTPGIYKKMLDDLEDTLVWLGDKTEELYALRDINAPPYLKKFQELFGFEKIGYLVDKETKIPHTIVSARKTLR